jgi:hypothetical protein
MRDDEEWSASGGIPTAPWLVVTGAFGADGDVLKLSFARLLATSLENALSLPGLMSASVAIE